VGEAKRGVLLKPVYGFGVSVRGDGGCSLVFLRIDLSYGDSSGWSCVEPTVFDLPLERERARRVAPAVSLRVVLLVVLFRPSALDSRLSVVR